MAEAPVAHTRALSSILSNLPQDSTIEFYGSRLAVKVQWERKAEYTETRFFKAIDATHWVEIVKGGRDGFVMHSAQMQGWLQERAKSGELLGFRVSDEDGRTLLEIGRM